MNTLSVVIPVYNVEKYLNKCLDSILIDNCFDGEVICVNDGCTDGSLAVLESYSKKYSNVRIVSQTNAGLSVARNTGLDASSGDYVLFIDSDDWIYPNSVSSLMGRVTDEDVVYFNARMYDESERKYIGDIEMNEVYHVEGSTYFETMYGKSRNVPFSCVWGAVYKTDFLMSNNLRNEPGILHEDECFTPQVLLAAKNVSCFNEYVYVYRIRSGSITDKIKTKNIRDLLFVARNLYQKYKVLSDIPDVYYKHIGGLFLNVILYSYEYKIPINALWKLSDSVHFLKCVDGYRARIAKLSFISTKMAYRFQVNAIPLWQRKIINRFL